MAPIALPENIQNEEWEPSSFTLIPPDIYRASIFAVEKKEKTKDGIVDRFYKITLRIQGGNFDGEDIVEQYVGMTNIKSFFRIYQILEGIGGNFVDTYYNKETKKWIALPTPEELQGKQVYVEMQSEPFQARDKTTNELRYDDHQQPIMLDSTKPNAYYDATKDKPAFRERSSSARVTPASPGAAAVVAGGGREVAPQYTGDTPW